MQRTPSESSRLASSDVVPGFRQSARLPRPRTELIPREVAASLFELHLPARAKGAGEQAQVPRGARRRTLTRIMREGAVEGETQEPPYGTNVVHTTF